MKQLLSKTKKKLPDNKGNSSGAVKGGGNWNFSIKSKIQFEDRWIELLKSDIVRANFVSRVRKEVDNNEF